MNCLTPTLKQNQNSFPGIYLSAVIFICTCSWIHSPPCIFHRFILTFCPYKSTLVSWTIFSFYCCQRCSRLNFLLGLHILEPCSLCFLIRTSRYKSTERTFFKGESKVEFIFLKPLIKIWDFVTSNSSLITLSSNIKYLALNKIIVEIRRQQSQWHLMGRFM